MKKLEMLKAITFGKRIAEEEGDVLGKYFVETDEWARISNGDVDVVYGAKGSGKSAIYVLLFNRREELNAKSIYVVQAENPRGDPAFKDLVADPPASEEQFRSLWKLYFLCITAKAFDLLPVDAARREALLAPLREARLIPVRFTLRGVLASVRDYVRRLTPEVESGMKIDPATGLPSGFYGKISLKQPTASQEAEGIQSADALLGIADEILKENGVGFWLLLDRLDVAFAESEQLERNALRALFRVYLDLLSLERLSLKIFLRNDVWSRITEGGFREASHVTRNIALDWNQASLLNLVVRRLLHNDAIAEVYKVDREAVLSNYKRQEELFYRIFPAQVESGTRRRATFEWMLSRTADGSGKTAPRELIHLLDCARRSQIQRLARISHQPGGWAGCS